MAQPVIDGRQVEFHPAGILRLEVVDLEVDHNEAPQAQVKEEEIEVEVLVADLEVILAADKGEALAEFEEEFTQVIE
jgi:methyl coenzyme M reductase subunit D